MASIRNILDVLSHPLAIALPILAVCAIPIVYRLFFHPLSHIPGPLLARISSLHLHAICFLGRESRTIEYYHRKYETTVLRISPNTVSISDGAALHKIYVAGGGFPKAEQYDNFRFGDVHSIFSSRDVAYRDARAKAVGPIFSMSRVKAAEAGIVGKSVKDFVQRVQSEKSDALSRPDAARVDVLALTYRLVVDSITGFLFNKTYGALAEPHENSALPFERAILEAERFSHLPNWIFVKLLYVFKRFLSDTKTEASFASIENFAASVTNNAGDWNEKGDTYTSRLLATGISKSEVVDQCMAVIFAGTNSAAVDLATIIFHLVKNPSIHQRLKEELKLAGEAEDTPMDLQTLPYLRAVVREGTRLGMANPARLGRVVPSEGFDFDGFHIPGGTDIGIAPFVLHHNPEQFPEPFQMNPDRWLNGTDEQMKKMERDWIPFSTGSRQCIAKNFAANLLFLTTKSIVESGVLEGARTCEESIELIESFNVQVKDLKLEIEWLKW